MTKFRASAIALVSVAGLGLAAASAEDVSFTASARILDALAVAKNTDLNFANIVPDATAAGTVVVSTGGVRTCNAPLTCTGTVSAADFDVTGTSGQSFTITLPSGTTQITNGSETMDISAWTSSLPSNTGTLNGGSADFQIGATLNVGAAQAAGAYSGSFNVTVEYN